MIDLLVLAAPSIALIGCIVAIVRLANDARDWRQDALELRDCWKFEKERREYFQRRLDEEMRRQKDGPYR